MRKISFLLVLCMGAFISDAQFVYKIKADSVLITNDSCAAELNLENSTKKVRGFLYNKGNGRTEFRRGVIKINDSMFLVGADTLKINSSSGANYWALLNNNIYNSNSGNVGIGTTTPLYKLDVTGDIRNTGDFSSTGNVTANIFKLNGAQITTYGNSPGYSINFNSNPGYYEGINFNLPSFSGDQSFKIAAVGPKVFLFNNGSSDLGISTAAGKDLTFGIVQGIQVVKKANGNFLIGENPVDDGINKLQVYGGSYFGSNVGVGTFSPTAQLHTTGTVRLEKYANNASGDSVLTTDASGNVKMKYLSSGTNSWLLSGTNLYNSNSGNVGIGTANPSYKLDINGKQQIVAQSASWSDPLLYLQDNNSGAASGNIHSGITSHSPNLLAGSYHNGLTFGVGHSLNNEGMMSFKYNAANSTSNYISFSIFGKTDILAMTANGNVGIGTVAPTAQLHTNGTVRFENYHNNPSEDSVLTTDASGIVKLKYLSSGVNGWLSSGNNLYNSNSGNVGISTNAPAFNLDVNGTGRIFNLPFLPSRDTVLTYDPVNKQLKVTKLPATSGWSLAGNAGTTPANFIGTTDNISLRIRTNNTQKVIIDSMGNVGITTAVPIFNLDVNGTARVNNLPFLPNRDTVFTYDPVTKQMMTTKLPASAGAGWSLTGNAGTTATNFIGTTDNISLRVRTNNTQKMIVDSIGNVGIATNAPAFNLDVNGTGRITNLPFLAARDTVLTYDPVNKQLKITKLPTASGWGLTGNAGTTAANFIGTTDNVSVRIKTNNAQRVIVDSIGNVGVATNAPAFNLDVNGSARVADLPFLTSSRDTILTYDPATKQIKASKASGTLIGVRVLTTGTSYTPAPGTGSVQIELVGAGGGGGGAIITTAGNASAGAGGGGGSLVQKFIAGITAGPFTYNIGSAGTGGTTAGAAGSNGGNTTITIGATTYTAPGGVGGNGGNASGATPIFISGGAGGVTGTNGDVNGSGQPGQNAMRLSGTAVSSGTGGSSAYGGAGNSRITAGAGNTATGFGGGGGGALSLAGAAQAGGAGSAGIIVIYEYR